MFIESIVSLDGAPLAGRHQPGPAVAVLCEAPAGAGPRSRGLGATGCVVLDRDEERAVRALVAAGLVPLWEPGLAN